MRLEATSFLRVLLFSLPLLTNCESKTSKIKKCDWDSSTCACETDQGSIRLDKMTDAPFKIKDEKTNSFFFWHPCRDFTEGTVTAGAIQQQVPSTYLDLGVHSSLVTEITADGHVIFKMLSDSKERHAFILCECTAGNDVTFTKEDPENQYNFLAKSEYCCPAKDGREGSSAYSLSIGTFIVIGFVAVAAVYFVAGVGYQIGVRKAQGIQRVPNIDLWSAIPGLVKDGFIFTFTCGRPARGSV